MKKEHPIRTLLGVTQEQIAMMLGIGRVQWALYESGKRDLPLEPKERLGEMLTFLKTLEGKDNHLKVSDTKAETAHAERQLVENEYQRLTLERFIATAEKKRISQVKLSLMNDFLEKRPDKAKRQTTFKLPTATSKAVKKSADNDVLIVEYRHQLALLNYEKSLLESKVKK